MILRQFASMQSRWKKIFIVPLLLLLLIVGFLSVWFGQMLLKIVFVFIMQDGVQVIVAPMIVCCEAVKTQIGGMVLANLINWNHDWYSANISHWLLSYVSCSPTTGDNFKSFYYFLCPLVVTNDTCDGDCHSACKKERVNDENLETTT